MASPTLYDELRPIPLERNPAAQEIVTLCKKYDEANKKLENEARRIFFGTGTISNTDFKKYKKQMNVIVDKLNDLANRWSKVATHKSYTGGQDIVDGFVNQLLEKGESRAILIQKDREKIKSFIDTLSGRVYREVRMVNEGMRKRLDDIITKGLKESKTIQMIKRPGIRGGVTTKDQIGSRLFSEIMEEGIKLQDSAGRMWKPETYTRMYARTRTREFQTQGTEDRMKENNLDLVKISEHVDVDGMDICNDYEGNVYSLSGKHSKYPVLPESPPFHPNCAHVETPFPEEIQEFIRLRQEGVSVEEAGKMLRKAV